MKIDIICFCTQNTDIIVLFRIELRCHYNALAGENLARFLRILYHFKLFECQNTQVWLAARTSLSIILYDTRWYSLLRTNFVLISIRPNSQKNVGTKRCHVYEVLPIKCTEFIWHFPADESSSNLHHEYTRKSKLAPWCQEQNMRCSQIVL